MRTISNSEASTWLQCRMKYYFAHVLNLEPKRHSTALARGIIGHDVLAVFYQALLDGHVYDTAVSMAMSKLTEYYINDTGDNEEMLMGLRTLLERYFVFAKNDNWEILAVEKSYDLPITDEFSYGLRLDLAARIDGEVTMVDHKFVYDFWSTDDLHLNPQLPKYIGTLRANGIMISRGMVNQIRHRTKKGGNTDDELFRRDFMRYNDRTIRGHFREQILVSQEISEYRALPVEKQMDMSRRTLNKMTCKNCSFKLPCLSSLEGADITHTLQQEYQPNSYGYNAEDRVGQE